MKKPTFVLYIFLGALSILSVSVQSVFGHNLQSSGSIGAVMHVDPNDAPVVDQQAFFFFAIKDKDNKFQFENCDCTGAIVQKEKVLYLAPLTQVAKNADPGFNYVFSQNGDYEVRLSGKAVDGKTFKDFEIEFPLQVTAVTRPSGEIYLAIVGGILLLGGGLFVWHRQRRGQ